MKSFKDFITESKNTHMTHLEDSIIDNGVEGARNTINYLRALRDMLSGSTKSSVNVTVKWDGCLDKKTEVLTNEGRVSLEQIAESWWSGKEIFVLAYDEESQVDVFVPINDCLTAKSSKQWVDVWFDDVKIACTEDHKFLTTNRGWVEAGSLEEGDDVKVPESINKVG